MMTPQQGYEVYSNEQSVDDEWSAVTTFIYTAGSTGGATQPRFRDFAAVMDDKSSFQCRGISIEGNASFNLRLTDSDGQYTSNAPIPSYFLQGDPAVPFSLYPGLMVPPGGRIAIEYFSTDTGAAATRVAQIIFRGIRRFHLAPAKQRYPLGISARDRFIDTPFWYYFVLPAIPASGVLYNQTLAIDKDADFAIRGMLATSNNSQFPLANLFNYQFRESNGRNFGNGFLSSAIIAGTPSIPAFVYPEIVIAAGGHLAVDVSGTAGRVPSILFRGAKRYLVAPDVTGSVAA